MGHKGLACPTLFSSVGQGLSPHGDSVSQRTRASGGLAELLSHNCNKQLRTNMSGGSRQKDLSPCARWGTGPELAWGSAPLQSTGRGLPRSALQFPDVDSRWQWVARNPCPRRAGTPETQPGEKRGWASAAGREKRAPGWGWGVGSPPDLAASDRAEVSEDRRGSAWSESRRDPWGSGPHAAGLSREALGDPGHPAEGPAHCLLGQNACLAWKFISWANTFFVFF